MLSESKWTELEVAVKTARADLESAKRLVGEDYIHEEGKEVAFDQITFRKDNLINALEEYCEALVNHCYLPMAQD